MAPLAQARDRGQRRSGDHGRDTLQDPENAVVDKDRADAGRSVDSGRATRPRTGAFRPPRLRATDGHPGGATVSGPPGVRVDAGVAGRVELRRLDAAGDQMPAQSARSRISRARPHPFPVPCAAAASTGGLRSRTGALLVLPRERRNPDRITPRPRIREETGRGRGRILAAGEGKPLARTGQRGAGSEYGSKMAPRRAPLPRSQATAGNRSIRGAPTARNAQAYGDSEADVGLRRRGIAELAQ